MNIQQKLTHLYELLINRATPSHEKLECILEARECIAKLEKETGHVVKGPANQYCERCGDAMFVKELSSKPCKLRSLLGER